MSEERYEGRYMTADDIRGLAELQRNYGIAVQQMIAAEARLSVLTEEGRRKDAALTSMREQRDYLVKHREPPDDARLRETISRLRQRLRNTREMFDRQVAATQCQRAKTGRVGNAAWTARQESVTFEYQTVDQAATILVLEQQIRTANARAAGYALLVGDLLAAFERLEASGPTLPSDASNYPLLRIAVGYAEMVAVKAILAADPEVRAADLGAAARTEGDPDRCAACQSKVFSGIGPFPWTCKNGHPVYCSGGPLTARHRIKPARREGD